MEREREKKREWEREREWGREGEWGRERERADTSCSKPVKVKGR